MGDDERKLLPEWMWPFPWEINHALDRVSALRDSKSPRKDKEPAPPPPDTRNELWVERLAQIEAAQPRRVPGAPPPETNLPEVIRSRRT